jgi:hypothetical protein
MNNFIDFQGIRIRLDTITHYYAEDNLIIIELNNSNCIETYWNTKDEVDVALQLLDSVI